MNIYDISRKAGVSIATVSRVLNNSDRVSPSTRQKVLDVVNREDYMPNAFARGLMLNTMKTVGMLCVDASDPYIGAAITHLENGLRVHNYDTLICCTGPDTQSKEKCLNMLLARKVDAIILIGSSFIERANAQNRYLRHAASQVPVLIVNGNLEDENEHIYSCLCDDERASHSAVKYMLATGCRSPLFLYRMDTYSTLRKKAGFRRAIEEAGCTFSEEKYVKISGDAHLIAEELSITWKSSPFDSVLAADDELAIGAVKFGRANNLQIPQALSIIGYNNSYLALCSEPELTSIDNRLSYICSQIVMALMGVFKGEDVPNVTMVSANLVLRKTTREQGLL